MPRTGGSPRVRSSRPPRRRPRSPATCPSRGGVRPWASASSREGREMAPAVLRILRERRHRHQARRRAPARARGRRGARRARSRPCPRRRATLTSTSTSGLGRAVRARAGCSAESEATEWISSRVREDLLDLAALELADEVPAEAGIGLGLGLELLRAVLADDGRGRPRRARRGPRAATYLTAASSSTSPGSRPALRAASAISASTRSRAAAPSRLDAADQARHTTPAWRPVTAAVAAVGEEQRAGRAHRAQPDVVDLVDARPPRAAARATVRGRGCARPTRASWPRSAAWTSSPTS